MIKYLLPLIYFLTVLIDAGINAYLIKVKNITIKHWKEALIYTIVCIIISVPLKIYLHVPYWQSGLFAFFTRLAFFDGLLNLLRGLSLRYEGDLNKPKEQQAFSDWLEIHLGIDIMILRTLYLAMYILNLIIFEL